jgi:atypical protein kinase C zeta type
MVESLDTRLRRNQILDKLTVLEVLRVEDGRLVERWAAELCAAVAWLESLGFAHTDLRPPNTLFDERDHLKLTDFDCVARIGERSHGNAPPWALLYNDPVTGHGHSGVDGPKNEQFAIGSLLYCMTRGHESYWQPPGVPEPSVVELFRKGIFPPVESESVVDLFRKAYWTWPMRSWHNQDRDSAEPEAGSGRYHWSGAQS